MTVSTYSMVHIVWHWKRFCTVEGEETKNLFLQRNWKHLSSVCVRFDPLLNSRCRGSDVKHGRQSPACEVPVLIRLSCPWVVEVKLVRWFAAGWWQTTFFSAASSQWHKIVSWFRGGRLHQGTRNLVLCCRPLRVWPCTDLTLPSFKGPRHGSPALHKRDVSRTSRWQSTQELPYQLDKGILSFNLLFLQGKVRRWDVNQN